jgi:hypothetical protein
MTEDEATQNTMAPVTVQAAGAVARIEDLTAEHVLSVLPAPTGSPMKRGAIVAQLATTTGLGDALYRKVDSFLQRMRREGRIELVKGRGAGWRVTTQNKTP